MWRPELAPLRGHVGGTLGPEDLPLSRAPPGRRREEEGEPFRRLSCKADPSPVSRALTPWCDGLPSTPVGDRTSSAPE